MSKHKRTYIIECGQRIYFDGLPCGVFSGDGKKGTLLGKLYLPVVSADGPDFTPVFGEDGQQASYMPTSTRGMVYNKQIDAWIGE